MASYNELNALIDAYINRNGVQAITGQILNGVLKAMVEQLGRGYTIMGAATPTTDPGTPDGPECYFASATGTYTDFDGLQIVPGELALLCYTPSDGWTKATIYEGFRQVGATIDGNVGTPSVGVSYANGVLSFDFHNMKGNPGQNGQDGAAAGFGTIGADIAGGVGTPGVTVESSGPATAKNLQFHFTNLKGETGVTSVVATVDNTTGTPACTVSLVGQQLTLAFTGLKGAQGDTGSSVDYPFTIVNNLTTDDATQALSAAQGVVLDGKITQLEAKVDDFEGNQAIPVTATGKYINLSGGVGTLVPSPASSGVWTYYQKSVSPGDLILVNGSGGLAPRLWGFVDENNKILAVADENAIEENLTLIAPSEASYIIINDKSNKTSYYSKNGSFGKNKAIVDKQIDTIDREVFGETINYTITADGSQKPLVPAILPGEIIDSFSSGVNGIMLYDENGGDKTIQASDLPFLTDRKYIYCRVYLSGYPDITITTKYIGLGKRVEDIEDGLSELEQRVDEEIGGLDDLNREVFGRVSEYALTADGAQHLLSPELVPGDSVISFSNGVTAVLLYDENGNTITLQSSSLPFLVDKKYVRLATYLVGTPDFTMTAKSDGLDKRVDALEEEMAGLAVDEDVKICVPDEIIAVVGDTLQLYYHSIYRCVDFGKYAVKVTCDIGSQYPRYYEITPEAGQVGEHALTFAIKDNNNKLLGTKTTTLKVVAVGTSPQSELNVLCLGASATQGGQWASEFKRRLVGTGGTPAGNGKSNIVFVGRKNVTFDGKQVNLEATGGYQFTSYTNPNTTRYRFNVTPENEPEINIGDVYSNNGNNYTIVEINISEGEGGYFSCTGEGTPQESGLLTKVTGTGTESINYSSTSLSGNPFAYGGVIDMQRYADEFCNPQGAEHGRIDVVYTELFGNGSIAYMDNFTTRMSQMQALIDQIRAVFPNCKFCIGLNWNPDVRGGMGVNYGANGNWSDPYGIKYTFMNLCNSLQEYITDNNMSGYVFIANWLNEFDTLNDMMQTTKKVNPRSSVTEIFGVNGVHPATIGYYQIADTAWRLFVAKFCQS